MENNNTKTFYHATVPSDWRVVKLKDIGKVGSGTTPSTIISEYWLNGTIPWLPTGKVNDKIIKNSQTFITEKAIQEKGIKLLPKGSIVIAMIGQGKTRGKTALLEIEAWVNQNFSFIIPNQSVDSKYLYTILDYNYGRIRYEGNRGGNQGSLNAAMIKSFKIPLPPLPEQRAIAKSLSIMDTAINKHIQLIAQKELRKKWLMQNLLSGKKRLNGFSGEWKDYSINKLFEKVYRYVKWDEKESYNLVSIRRRYGGLFFRGNLLGENIGVKKLKSIQTGDFLISKRQVSHGAWVVVTDEFDGGKVSDEYDCLKISNDDLLNADFWGWFCQQKLMSHYAYLDSIGIHIEKLIFHHNLFKKRKVRIPISIAEQSAIAQVLNTADKEIGLLKAKNEKLREQKKGMMQLLLTGKKRLNYDLYD